MSSHVYITINLFNLCQQSFLPFYIYFLKCWHRLNEPPGGRAFEKIILINLQRCHSLMLFLDWNKLANFKTLTLVK